MSREEIPIWTNRKKQPTLPPNPRLLTADEVAEQIFHGTVSSAWIRRTVPGKLRLGYTTVRWWKHEVLAWVDSQRAEEEL